MADVITDGVAAFRRAVERWVTSPNPTDAAIALRAAPTVLEILNKARTDLDDARRDRNGFVEEIRDLNDQLAGARANVTALKTSCQSLQDLVDELRAEARGLAEQVAVERRRGMGAVQ